MPSDEVLFLSLDEVLEIHARVIDAFGGASGLRDIGLLESALYRPRSGYYENLPMMAAALFQSLLINHPFVDGNKRVAFFATDVFLRLNGWRVVVESADAHEFIMRLLSGDHADLDQLNRWICDSISPIPE